MNILRLVAGWLLLCALLTSVQAQAPLPLPILDDKPIPQFDASGPSAAVTALAFGADDKTLYSAGLDKVVRVWKLDPEPTLQKSYRVPIGPGNAGAINAVALSPDGAWLAIAGRAPMRNEVTFREGGVLVAADDLAPEQLQDLGLIYVASTANPAGGKVLRGHFGEVRALAFAPSAPGKPPLLVSAATNLNVKQPSCSLCLWDVVGGKRLAERLDMPRKVARPGLAVWHTGPGLLQVRVAVAWPEESDKKSYLRLWDPSPNADPLQRWKADDFTRTAVLAGRDGVLVGGIGPSAGRLTLWHFSADRDTEATGPPLVEFPPPQGTKYLLPVSLAVLPAEDGTARYAAAVLWPDPDADFRLALVDLSNKRVVADLSLTGSDRKLPILAARGRFVAVSATRDHAVRVYAVDDLIRGKTEPRVILRSDGLAPEQVAFVDGGKSLWLSQDATAQARRGGLVFDLDKRQVRTNDRDDLAEDGPKLGDWSFTVDKESKSVTVRQGGKDLPPVRLSGKDVEITAVALRPPGPGRPGVLAVATTRRDTSRTLILLSDPVDGKPLRQLIGHLQDVRGLAFSTSRPLLASVADDQTVCVWRLGDLESAHGQLPGFSIAAGEGKKIVVRHVEPGGPAAQAGLAEGDVIEALAAAGAEARPVKDVAQLIWDVFGRRPGEQIAVTIAGKGVVKLTVGRGLDIRKPLFSLFLLRGRPLPEWVGWSPAGPYDASSPAAEAHLGWHTNTGDPAAPVSFAAAQQYQKEYRREGILGDLAAAADLGRALDRWKARNPDRPPQAFLVPDRPDEAVPGESDDYLVRQPVKGLRVGINADYALDDRHSLRWRVTRADGGKVQADALLLAGNALRDGAGWRVDLSGVDWRRGEYRLWLGLHTRADAPDPITQLVSTFRFQPPAPILSVQRDDKPLLTTEDKPLEVMEDKLILQIAVEASAGQQAEVTSIRSRNGVAQPGGPPPRSGTFVQEYKLQEGLNHLALQAVNKDALAGHEDLESTATEVWVKYKAPVELPPRFTDLRLDAETESQRLDGKDVQVVSRSPVRLSGKVQGNGPLVRAAWSVGEAPPRSFLPEREVKETEFVVDLDLKAGELVPIRLRAQSKHSDENTEVRWLLFHPTLPDILVDPLKGPDSLTDEITLTGAFQAATKDLFDLTFRVTTPDGKVKPFTPDLDKVAGTWKVQLRLFPGSNTVEALAANRWRGARVVAGPWNVRYRRPPRITKVPTEIKAVETNKVSLEVTVEGPIDRPLQTFTVNDKAVRFVASEPVAQADRWVWSVKLPEVFVNDGEHNLKTLAVRAITDEGASPEVVIAVEHVKIPRPPLVRFLSPTSADTARRAEYPILFRVDSVKPLESVAIYRDGEMLVQADLKKVVREESRQILQEEVTVLLKNGANVLELVAVNTDGRNSPRETVVVSYTEPAVLVSIDRIEVRAATAKQLLNPTYGSSGDLSFPTAPSSLVWLIGQVRWSDPKAPTLETRNLDVVVKVGDCRQFPARLGPRGQGDKANVRSFEVPAVLIGANNRIKIEVPSVSQEDLSRGGFELACAAPAQKERLHLLVIGVNVKDAARLKDRVLDALAVDPRERPSGLRGEFSKKPFDRCVLYQVLVGEVDRGKVEGQLAEINRTIKDLREKTGWLNDVVLIYYQGEDVAIPERNERWLKTSRNYQLPGPPQEWAIPCHALPRVPGAQLLLLNVAGGQDVRANSSNWGGDPDSGFLRYASLNRTDVVTADPALLGLLKDAARQNVLLGDMIRAVNDRAGQQPMPISPRVVLDQDQAGRRFNEPTER